MTTQADVLAQLAADPRYRRLVRSRGRFAGVLTAVMLLAYFGFILLVAFGRQLLAHPLGGGATSLGIPVGLGLILLAIALTGIFVRRANRDYDVQVAALVEEFDR